MIIILTQCFPSRVGGIETLMYDIALNLSHKHNVKVLADQQDSTKDLEFDKNNKNFSILRFKGLKFLRKRKKFNQLKNICVSNNIEAVITDSWKSLELPINFLKEKKIPIISLVHGNEIIIKNDNHHKRIKKVLELANALVVNSSYTKNLLSKISENFKKIEVIYPGVKSTKNIIEQAIDLDDSYPTLLTLARLEKRKGHSYILKSIFNLKKIYPDIQYIIAGEGDQLENIKKEIKNYNLESNVKLVGTINENQKKFIFSKTDIMIMPTIDETHANSIEGFGIAYIEAAQYGIPSIASNVGGTPEAVLHNKTGLIINNFNELDESIKNLVENKENRIELGQNAKNRAENELIWKKQVVKYNKLIDDIQLLFYFITQLLIKLMFGKKQ